MKQVLINSCILLSSYLQATTYEEVIKTMGSLGKAQDGEIEILTDPIDIESVTTIQKARYLKKGFGEDFAKNGSKTGIIMEDLYWVLVRDPVKFPGGGVGTYNRLLWKSNLSGPSGVAMLPVNQDNKILLNINYRHATRSWEIELPRGCREENETIYQAAERELKEETGAVAKEMIYLGELAPDTGALCAIVPAVLVKYDKVVQQEMEFSEAIEKTVALSLKEVEELMVKGKITINIKGTEKVAYLRDSFLFFALYQAKLKSFI